MRLNGEHRLATYGTLAPGRRNHHHVSMIDGRWISGHVVGTLVDKGWAVEMGYPAFDPNGNEQIEVWMLESKDLPEHWPRLDEFETEAYRRVMVPVFTEAGEVMASIYIATESTY